MKFRTEHGVELGYQRLMAAPRDVTSALDYPVDQPQLESARGEYRRLFKAYLRDFKDVFIETVELWESDLDELMEEGAGLHEAIEEKIDLCAAGPAENPIFIWLIRKYWLKCDELGQESTAQAVRPEVFLLGWLRDDGHDDYVQLITAMPYWPIGLDEHGNWC